MKKVILFFAIAMNSVLSFAVSKKAPAWMEHREVSFPSEIFVSATGEGESEEEAKSNAISQISLFFNTSTTVCNELIKKYNEAESGKSYNYIEETDIKESAVIHSQADFFGVQFTDCFSAKKRVFVCAYINREDAFKVYESTVKQNAAAIQGLLLSAESGNPVRAKKDVERAVSVADITAQMIKNARILKNVSPSYFESSEKLIAKSYEVLQSCRENLIFAIFVDGDYNNAVSAALSEILEKNGYATAKNGSARNAIRASVSAEESETAAGVFLYCTISIEAALDGRKPYFSYSRTFDKKGGRKKADAYRLSYKMIQNELEKSFLSEFEERN